jgi:hypothetical protein
MCTTSVACCWCWLASSLPSSPGSAPSLSFTSWTCSWLQPVLLLLRWLLVLLLLARSWASDGLHGVCWMFLNDEVLLLWKNSDVPCGVECEQLHLVQLQVMLTWSTAWCCWQLWCCQHKFCMQWLSSLWASCHHGLIWSLLGRDVNLLCAQWTCTPVILLRTDTILGQIYSVMQLVI